MICGVFGHPNGFWQRGFRLGDLGINAVFVSSGDIDQQTIDRTRAEGGQIFAEFATLNGDYGDYVANHPEAHPIDESGQLAARATWFMGACPTYPGFRAFRMDELRTLLSEHEVDGVWMDYLHWHAQFEDPYPMLCKTCFNESCLDSFQFATDIEVRGDTTAEKAEWILLQAAQAWEDWRVSVVVDWAREFHAIVKEIRPAALVGNYQAAWQDEDFWGARRRCLGLDFDALAPYVDVFSPMPYHGRSGMPLEYVRDYAEYFSTRHDVYTEPDKYPRLWPIVQAFDAPRVEPAELATVLEYGLAGKSSGVIAFTIDSVIADLGQIEVVKNVYCGRSLAPLAPYRAEFTGDSNGVETRTNSPL